MQSLRIALNDHAAPRTCAAEFPGRLRSMLGLRLGLFTYEEHVVVRCVLAIAGGVFGVIRLPGPRRGARRAIVGGPA